MYIQVNWLSVAGLLQAFAESKPAYERPNKIARIKKIREITIEDLGLEPPCDEVVKFHCLLPLSLNVICICSLFQLLHNLFTLKNHFSNKNEFGFLFLLLFFKKYCFAFVFHSSLVFSKQTLLLCLPWRKRLFFFNVIHKSALQLLYRYYFI